MIRAGDEVVVCLKLSHQPSAIVADVWADHRDDHEDRIDVDVDCGGFTIRAYGVRPHQSGEDPYWTWSQPSDAANEDEARLEQMRRAWEAMGFSIPALPEEAA